VVGGERPLKGFKSLPKKQTQNLKSKVNPDKANPFVRRGRKAAGLFGQKDGRVAEG